LKKLLARGLLARAEYYRVTGDLHKAQKDVEEAFSIASRGGMGLHLADCHLEYARLYLSLRGAPATKQPPGNEEIASGDPSTALDEHSLRSGRALVMTQAREHLKTAKEMIEKMGYHRRDKEVEALEEAMSP
jgi:hypothetical protein